MKTLLQRGFTLIELLVTVSVIGFVFGVTLLLFGSMLFNCSGQNGAVAEEEAIRWAAQMGIKPQGVQCARTDTDGDGYVSCSASEKRPDGTTQIHAIECASSFSLNSGCRVPKLGIR